MDLDRSQFAPEDPFAKQHEFAEKLIGSGDFQQAAEVLVDIVQKDPANARAYNAMGVLSWAREKWQDAYVLFLKAASLGALDADALVNLFDAALKLKKAQEVLPYLEKALAADPSLDEVRTILDSIKTLGDEIYFTDHALEIGTWSPIIEQADAELDSGNVQTAMKLYLQANDEEGPSAAAYNGLGIVSYYQKRYNDAFSLFVESIKLNPLVVDTFHNLLDAAKACGKTDAAIQIYQACLKKYPRLESIKSEFAL